MHAELYTRLYGYRIALQTMYVSSQQNRFIEDDPEECSMLFYIGRAKPQQGTRPPSIPSTFSSLDHPSIYSQS